MGNRFGSKAFRCFMAFVLCFQMLFTDGVTSALAEGISGATTVEQQQAQLVAADDDQGQADDSDESTDSDAAQPVAKDWSDSKDNLKLATDGLEFGSSLAVQAKAIADKVAAGETDVAVVGTAAENASDVVLPATMSASLNIKAKLDVSAGNGRNGEAAGIAGGEGASVGASGADAAAGTASSGDAATAVEPSDDDSSTAVAASTTGGNSAVGDSSSSATSAADSSTATATPTSAIVEGDSFKVTLPAGITSDTASAKLAKADDELRANVYALDPETGQATETVVGYAVVADSAITVKLFAPAAATASEQVVIDLDVLVSSDLIKAEENTLTWAIQSNADEVQLALPVKTDVAAALGLVAAEAAIAPVADEAESTGSKIGDTKKVQSGKTSAQQFVTHWADNNAEVRPSAATLLAGNEYRLYYSTDGGTTKKALTTDGVNLTDEAKTDLGIQSLTPSAGALLNITQTATNDYTVTSTNELPQTIITKELKRIDTDEETGEETEVWETTYTKTVTYYISHDYDSTADPVTAIKEGSKIYAGSDGKAQYIVSPKSSLKTADQQANKYINEYQEEVISLLSTQKFTVKYSFGEGIDDRFTFMQFFMQKPGYQTFTVHIGDFYYNLTGDDFTRFYEEGYFTGSWSDSAPHSTGTIEVTAPTFYADGTPMEYSYTQQAEDQDPDAEYVDTFQIRYDNSKGTNHGSDVSAVYEGGTIYLIHSGTTKYAATKKWADDDATARPATTYSLWRYVDNGSGDYGTASQVKAADNSGFVEFTISAADNQAAGSNDIDLGAKLQEKLTATGTTLAKYDSAGYSYVYMLREDAVDGYERLYGTTINTDESSADYGKIVKGSDTKPNYYDSNTTLGTKTASTAKDTRPSGDRSVYNGGTIINRRTDTATVKAEKSWIVGTFQDQLTNVTSVFQLQRIAKVHATQNDDGTYSPNGTIDESTGKAYDWVDVAGGTKEITGWTAETLTQEFEGGGAKYDALGEEYVYRYIETDVKQGDTSVVTAKGDDGVTAFHLTLTDNDGSSQDVSFNVTRTRDAQTGETKIQNRYVDVTDAHVHKYWAETETDSDGNVTTKKDANGNTVWTQAAQPNGASHQVKFTIVRTGVDGNVTYGPYTLDGTVDSEATSIDGLDGATVQETTAWNLDFQNLPMYDENGSKYTYMCFETNGVSGWSSSRSYSPKQGGESNVTTVYNSPSPGNEWSRISVTKKWTDGGNTSSRVPVKVGIYAAKEMYNQKYKDWVDGGSQGNMPSGAVHYDKDQLIREVTLTESNGWYYEGGISIGSVSQKNGDVYIREISNGQTGEQASTVVTKAQAEAEYAKYVSDPTQYAANAIYSDILRNWGDNSSNQYNERMLTGTTGESEDYCYQVNYGFNDSLNAMQVENRRLGQTWVKVTKAWNDQGHDSSSRPDCTFKISCTTSAVTFSAGEGGYIYAQVNGGNKLLLYKEYIAGKADTPMTTADATVSEDGRYLILKINTSIENDTLLVGSLPKYDGQGFVFSYNVEEEISNTHTDSAGNVTQLSTNDYYSAQTSSTEKYNSTYHFTDSLEVGFTNGRSATKDVVFNTRWYDAYVSGTLNQRPDLYLTLYKSVYQYDDSGNLVYNEDGTPKCTYEVVTDYENYKWSSLIESTSGHDNERATIKNLQKYDSHGKEIIYYATCATHTTQSSLDNLDYQAQWDTTTNQGVSGKDAGNDIWDTHNASDSEVATAVSTATFETADGKSVKVLREDGTFNYQIASSINISGQKIWGNFPGIYKRADLPAISVYLQRRVAGSDTAWQNPTFVAADNDQGYTIQDIASATGSDVADGKTVIAGTHNLTYASYGKFSFNMKYYGINTTDSAGNITGETEDAVELPKYDANGNLYEYRTIEVIDGLLSTDSKPVPGGFTIDDLNNSTTDIAKGNPDKVFVTKSGDGSSYSINNNYGPSTGKLTVKKVFDGYTSGDKFANLTYTLYRYYIKADGTHSDTQLVDTETLEASQIGTDGTGQVTFSNVDIYDPNGQYWVYYVVETCVDGYSTQVMLGNASGANDSAFADADTTTVAGGYTSPDTYEAYDTGADGSQIKYSKSTRVADDETPDFTFKNTYAPETISLKGTKVWNDNSNVASIRPSDISITVKRAYSDGSADQSLTDGKLELQSNDASKPNYLQWTKNDTGNWTYTISNVEKWATNGAAWRYTVTEDSSSVEGTEYVITSTGGTVTASDGASFPNIVNDLKTKVQPKKVWVNDDSDWLAQRPTFYYELQARFVSTDGASSATEWKEVGAAFKDATGNCPWTENTIQVSDGETLTYHAFVNKDGSTVNSVGSVSPDGKGKNEWTGTAWDNLPTSAKVKVSDVADSATTVKNVEYRVVEKYLVYGQDSGAPTVVKFADPDADGKYAETYYPYSPSISSSTATGDDGQVTITSTMTNTLDSTSVSVTKSWDDDNNTWASRPGTAAAGDTWTLQFAIQRTTDGTNWEWVTTYGAAVADDAALNTDGTFNENLRVVELSSADASASKTFENLPKADTKGNAYTYRLAERLTGSYSLSGTAGTTIATALDGKVKLVTVPVDATSGSSDVTFNNSLKTVGLEGTKNWNDYGAGLVPSFDNPPTMVLQQRIGSGDWTEAKYADGTKPQITWSKTSDTVWSFSYSGLPATDKSGNTIEYRAIENMSASNGYVESYANGEGSTFDSDHQMFVNNTITNTATRFTLKKIGDNTTGSSSEELDGVTLKVRKTVNGETKTYAVWMRDGGVAKSYVNVNGVTEDASSTDLSQFTEMTGSNAGYIIALAAGTYTITETRTPEGHLQAADATVTISATGAISAKGATLESDSLTLDITDPVFRGNVDLYKYYRHADDGGNSMPGMTFDLYQGTPDGTNVKIAEGITLQKYTKDYIGKWYGWATGSLSKQDMAVDYLTDSTGASLLGKYYTTTADGLPLGNYFFKETGTSPYTVKAETTYAFTIAPYSDAETHQPDATKQPAYVFQRAENTEFNVEAYVAKVNSEDGTAVNNATFKLEYIPEGSTSTDWTTIGSDFVTGSTYKIGANMSGVTKVDGTDGELRFKYLKKGQYRLTELSDSGYEVGTGDNATVATWTISEADQNKTVDLADGSNLAVPGVTWANAAFKEVSTSDASDASKTRKLSNTPEHGAVKMTKVSSASAATTISGTTMKLQKKSGDTWVDVVADSDTGSKDLMTGKNYLATVDATGAITALTEDAPTPADSGTITVSNLPWGTYKFVETKQADGYVGKTGTSQAWAESSELTISRENVETSQTAPVTGDNVVNKPTNLKIVKANADGTKYLGGAKFTVSGKFVSGDTTKTMTKNLTSEVNTGEAKPVSSDDVLEGQLIVGETYTITETEQPDGYTYDNSTSVYKVTMTDTGFVVAADGQGSVSGWSLNSSDAASSVSTLTRNNTPTKIIIFKNDENGHALEGSEFAITGKMSDGTTSATIEPKGESTSSVVEKLIVGETYTISESKVPAGYTKIGDVQVKVNSDGTLQFVGDVPVGWELHDSGWALTASDVPAEFSLKKVDDSADAKTLANGTFSVSGLFVDADGNVTGTTKDFTTTSSAATLKVDNVLVEGTAYTSGNTTKTASGDYVISEKTSPLGYAVTAKKLTIHVNADGSVAVKGDLAGDSPYSLDTDAKLVTLSDTPISFSFSKKNASGDSLDGAKFTISGKFADMNGGVGETQTLTNQTISGLSALKFAQNQEYELTETASPAGYELISGTVKFKLDQTGKATITSVTDGYAVDQGGMSITATDTATSLKIKKVAADGTALSGAKFSVVPAEGSTWSDGTADAIELTTGNDGTVDVADAKLVVGKTYYLSETEAPAGYKKINGQFKIDVASDGTVTGTTVDVKNGSFSVADSKVEVDVADEVIPFSLTKYSSEGYAGDAAKALSGAVFAVTPADGSAFAGGKTDAIEFTTGADGKGGSGELAGKLVVGKSYTLQEKTAPAGYKLVSGSMTFTVNEDGSLSATNADCPAAYHMNGAGEITVFTGDVTDDPTRIAVRKVSSENTALGLGGATFELVPVNGSKFADGTTAAVTATTQGDKGSSSDFGETTGFAEFNKAMLVADGASTYQLRETVAPWGYELNTYAASFTVATDGTVSFTDADAASAAGYSVTGDGSFTLTAKDTPVDVTLKKTDSAGTAKLANTKFAIAPAEGTNDDGEANHFVDGSTVAIEKATDTEGTASLHNVLVAGNSYTVTESTPTEGYGSIDGSLTIKVNADGTIQKVSGPDAYAVDGANAAITASDVAIDISFAKSASDGASAAAMRGAEFTIAPAGDSKFAGGSTAPITLTIGESGASDVCSKQLLAGGSYTISETKAPNGFKPLADSITVNVSATGQITLSDDSKAATGWALSKSGTAYVVSAVDDSTSLKIVKTNADGSKMLAGTQFSITGKFTSGQATKNLVTDNDGVAKPATDADSLTDEFIVGETYAVKETVPPAGYTYDSATAEFRVTMTATGFVTAVSDQGQVSGWSLTDDSESGVSVLMRSNTPTNVFIAKVDDQGNALGGSEFTIAGKMADGSESCVVAPGVDSAATVAEKLIVGQTYTVSETKVPAGYAKIADVQVSVNNGGTLSFVGAVPAGWSIDASGLQLTAKDKPVAFSLAKADASASAQKLSNATFTVIGLFVDDEGNVAESTREFTTSDDQKAVAVDDALVEGTAYAAGDEIKLADGDYVIAEKTSPFGYLVTDKTFAIHVNADGSVTAKNAAAAEADSSYSLDAASKLVTLTDTAITFGFAKKATDGSTLDGAEFTITGKFADGQGGVGEIQTLTKQSIAQLSALKFAQGQEYELTETKAPAGYELIDGTVKFALDQSGKAAITAAVDGYALDEGGVSITATDVAISIQLKKTASDGTPLSGAVFSLKPADGSAFASGSTDALTLTTKSDGTIDSLDAVLVAGNVYYLSETTAPAGYKQIAGWLKIEVAADGTVTGTPVDVKNGSFGVADSKVEVDVADEVIPFSLTKYSSEGYAGDAAKALSGAVFAVTPAEGSAFADGKTDAIEFITGADGKGGSGELAGKLVVGKSYTLQEKTAPAGYKLVSGSMTFTVNGDGSLSATNADCPTAYHMNGAGEITVFTGDVTDDPTRIAVRKVSSENTALGLGGATFELVPAQGSTFADGTTDAVTATTQGRGSSGDASATTGFAEFDKAMLIADGKTTYQIRETAAPWGYELNTYSASFTVATDGTVSFTDADAASAAGYSVTGDGSFTLTAKDTPIDMTLKKSDTTGKLMLAGTKYTVAPAEDTNDDGEANHFADGSKDAIEATTNASGEVTLRGQLVAGNSYTVTEATPTEGYGSIEGSLTIKVNVDGTIQKVSGPDAYAVDGANAAITGLDAPIQIQFFKSSSDDKAATAMQGAEFTIAPAGDSKFAGGSADPITLTIGENALSDVLSTKLVAGGSYTISETKAPAGYKPVQESIAVNVSMIGEVTLAEESKDVEDWGITPENGIYIINALDEPTGVGLVKRSADSEGKGEALAGAEYELAGKFAKGDGSSEQKTATVKTLADGELEVNGVKCAYIENLIVGETYALTETKAPAGYELNSNMVKFTVDQDGKVTIASEVDGYAVDQDGMSITATDIATSLKIKKTTADGTPLSGAKFSLEPASGSTFADGSTAAIELTTGNDGTIDVADAKLVANGSYYLAETEAPAGYKAITGQYRIDVAADGTVAGTLVNVKNGTYSVADDKVEVDVTDDPTRIAVRKVSSENTTLGLGGATFELVPAEGSTFADGSTKAATVTTQASGDAGATAGFAEFDKAMLIADGKATYQIRETAAPWGYELNAYSASFTVAADGTVNFTDAEAASAAGYSVTGDGSFTLTAQDTPIDVTLKKTDSAGTAKLANAKFTVAPAKGTNNDGEANHFADGSKDAIEVTTNADGELTLHGQLVAGNSYTISETKAPAGYKVLADSVTVNVSATGQIALSDDSKAVAGWTLSKDGTAYVVSAVDEPVSVGLLKYVLGSKDGDEPLAGAQYQLSGTFAVGNGATQQKKLTIKTLADGRVEVDGVACDTIQNLIVGETYVLTETEAPEGYDLDSAELHFTVGDDGLIEVAKGYEIPACYQIEEVQGASGAYSVIKQGDEPDQDGSEDGDGSDSSKNREDGDNPGGNPGDDIGDDGDGDGNGGSGNGGSGPNGSAANASGSGAKTGDTVTLAGALFALAASGTVATFAARRRRKSSK